MGIYLGARKSFRRIVVSQGFFRSRSREFRRREKNAEREEYRPRLVACLFPSESSVRKERISSEAMDSSSLSWKTAENLERRYS